MNDLLYSYCRCDIISDVGVFSAKTVNYNISAKLCEVFINVYMNTKEILD